VEGRTFDAVIGAAAGEQDELGASFSSETFVENSYVMDGDAMDP